jgi:hypothetical protein
MPNLYRDFFDSGLLPPITAEHVAQPGYGEIRRAQSQQYPARRLYGQVHARISFFELFFNSLNTHASGHRLINSIFAHSPSAVPIGGSSAAGRGKETRLSAAKPSRLTG